MNRSLSHYPDFFINHLRFIQKITDIIFHIFVLLPNKETIIYEKVLKDLIDIYQSKLLIKFDLKMCIVDFANSIGTECYN